TLHGTAVTLGRAVRLVSVLAQLRRAGFDPRSALALGHHPTFRTRIRLLPSRGWSGRGGGVDVGADRLQHESDRRSTSRRRRRGAGGRCSALRDVTIAVLHAAGALALTPGLGGEQLSGGPRLPALAARHGEGSDMRRLHEVSR